MQRRKENVSVDRKCVNLVKCTFPSTCHRNRIIPTTILQFVVILLTLQIQSILGARSTDELDNGFVVREESSHWNYHWNYSDFKTTEKYPLWTTQNIVRAEEQTGIMDVIDLKYWGCYRYWSGQENANHVKGTEHLEIDPLVCMEACEVRHERMYPLAMVKGHYCECVDWEYFSKNRIADKFCNFPCPFQRFESLDGTIEPPSYCGGNLGISVFCDLSTTDEKCQAINEDKIEDANTNELETFQANNVSPVYKLENMTATTRRSVLGIGETGVSMNNGPRVIQPCAHCNETYNSPVGPMLNCGIYSGIKITQDYFPINNPQECSDNCRNITLDNKTVMQFPLAILHWIPIAGQASGFDRVPVCRCATENPMKKDYWYPASTDNCQACPGDKDAFCGSREGAMEYFTVYCTEIDYMACELEENDGDGGDGEDDDPWSTPSELSSSEPDTKGSPSSPPSTHDDLDFDSTSTEDTTVATTTASKSDMSIFTNNTITESTTVEIESSSSSSTIVENTTEPVVDSTSAIVYPITNWTTTSTTTTSTTTESTTTTTKSTTASTTTSTTPAPAVDCRVTCEAVDHYNKTWTACGGEVKVKECDVGDGKNGMASWKCLLNGTFENSSPNFSKCATDWYDDLLERVEDALSNNTLFPKEDSEGLLKDMEEKCTVSETNRIPYFGHEIKMIAYLSWQIVNFTKAKLEERQVLLAKAINLPGLLLKNRDPWLDMSPSERALAGQAIIQSIELSMFTLSQNVNSSSPGMNRFNYTQRAEALDESDFLSTFGVRSKSNVKNEPLIFPLDATPKSSFIQLSEGWENISSTPEFVGISIDPNFINNVFSPQLSSMSESLKNTTGRRLINGRLLALRIKGLDTDPMRKLTNLKGKTVKITFQHQVEAWGDKVNDVPRRLHKGETAKVAIGSAACVYWNVDKAEWSKDGCKVLESTTTHTVCECTHLTSFAVLMDTHNYVGKDFILEILTLILSPLSVICLLVTIVIFSTVGAIQCQRTTITKHLSICLLIGNVTLLFVVDRNYFHLPEGMCIAVGIMTHYIFLAAFVWMQIEGIHLYKMVVHVFESGRSHTTIYRIIAYGIPVLIVGVNCVVGFLLNDHPYASDMYCWLEGPYIWSFIGPVAIIIMGNMIILFVALKTAYQMQAATAAMQNRQRSYKTWIRGSFSITIILGITWLPGFFITTGSSTAATIAAYIFVVLNASQGIFLFVFHCFMNEKVRTVAERNLSLPSWLSLPSNPSKEVTQSGKRSDVMKAIYSETSKSFRQHDLEQRYPSSHTSKKKRDGSVSSVFSPEFNPYGGEYNKDPSYALKAQGSIDSGLNESRTSSQKSLVTRTSNKKR